MNGKKGKKIRRIRKRAGAGILAVLLLFSSVQLPAGMVYAEEMTAATDETADILGEPGTMEQQDEDGLTENRLMMKLRQSREKVDPKRRMMERRYREQRPGMRQTVMGTLREQPEKVQITLRVQTVQKAGAQEKRKINPLRRTKLQTPGKLTGENVPKM